ncbi:MAG: YeeE/YedE family protein [Pseudomonadota bacterium]
MNTFPTLWNPWLAGAAIGLYVLLQYWLTARPLGCSSPLAQACGMIFRLPFFRTGEFTPAGQWRLWFMVGLPLGGLVAVLSQGQAGWIESMGRSYDAMLPSSVWTKVVALFAGGVLIGFGARMAGGCTSGHTIVGMALFNPASAVASALFFAGGLLSVQILARIAGLT